MEGKHFQVNLPDNKQAYKSGNGEGIWVVAESEEDFKKYIEDKPTDHKTTIKVKVLNNSVYYPSISYGTVIEVELRKGKRPIMKPLLTKSND